MDNVIKCLDDVLIKNLLIYQKIQFNPDLKHFADLYLEIMSSEKLDKNILANISNIKSEIETEFQKHDIVSIANPSSLQYFEQQSDKPYNVVCPSILKPDKPSNKPIRIYMDGVFDIIHSGHFNAIRQSKKLGEILVVGVNSDIDVEKSKGPTLMNGKERAALVRACKWVDEVVEDTPYTPTVQLLDDLNIDFCAHGDDMPVNAHGFGCYDEIKNAGRLKVFKRTEGISTTEIIGRLLMCTKESDRQKIEIANKGNLPITSNDLIKDFNLDLNKYDENEFYKGPVMSNFLTTGWRLIEFCNKKFPKQNEKVVYIDGAFDILHIGHIEILKKAKENGDFLYVGIHDDKTVNGYLGKNSPILNLQERVFNLLALKYVDDVVIGAPLIINEDLIRSLKIDVVLNVKNSKNNNKIEALNLKENLAYEIPKKLGIYEEISCDFELSNEILVKRILEKRQQYVKKYQTKSENENIYYTKEKEFLTEL